MTTISGLPSHWEIETAESIEPEIKQKSSHQKIAMIGAFLGGGVLLASLSLYLAPIALPFAASIVLFTVAGTAALVVATALIIFFKKSNEIGKLAARLQGDSILEQKNEVLRLIEQYTPSGYAKNDGEKIYRKMVDKYKSATEEERLHALLGFLRQRDLRILIILMFTEKATLNVCSRSEPHILLSLLDAPMISMNEDEERAREKIILKALLLRGADPDKAKTDRDAFRDRLEQAGRYAHLKQVLDEYKPPFSLFSFL